MQQSQRAEYNHALEYAIQQANKMGQGVVVVFGLMDDYPEANLRQKAIPQMSLSLPAERPP
jgi:deoxyribodipyrimidine photo-lyase